MGSRTVIVVVVSRVSSAELDATAALVDLIFPDLHAEQRLLAVGGERAGQRHAEADLDGLAGLRLRLRCRRQGEQSNGRSRTRQTLERRVSVHSILPENVIDLCRDFSRSAGMLQALKDAVAVGIGAT